MFFFSAVVVNFFIAASLASARDSQVDADQRPDGLTVFPNAFKRKLSDDHYDTSERDEEGEDDDVAAARAASIFNPSGGFQADVAAAKLNAERALVELRKSIEPDTTINVWRETISMDAL